jgi:phospholipid-binding lipoprotein MlaA
MMIPRRVFGLLLLLALGGLGGCATTGGSPGDPLEGLNRATFGFNEGVDKMLIKPLAIGYKTVLPTFARTGVTNFFANLGDIWIGINNVLQGKIGEGASDFGRFALNSTAGLLGFFDVASNAGLEKHDEDFGQTLGRWGVGSGAYLVLPFLGPSSFRDGLSRLLVDWRGNPLWYTGDVATGNTLVGVSLIDSRANLLDISQLAEDAALDYYSYVRGAYLQRRRSQIYDGDPPRERDPDQSSVSVPGAVPAAQAGAGTAPAGLAARPVEAPIAGADADLKPAQEPSDLRAQQIAVSQATSDLRANETTAGARQ